MIRDPRQIVTPFAFQVHPELLGLPLATPKRRLAALLLDLIIASIFASLGNFFLALGVSVIFFWIAIRSRGTNPAYNFMRFGGAGLASILVFGLSLGIIEGFDTSEEKTSTNNRIENIDGIETEINVDEINWMELGSKMAAIDYSNADSLEHQLEHLAEDLTGISATKESSDFLTDLPEDFPEQLSLLQTAITTKDSLGIDSLRSIIAPILASTEINELKNEKKSLRNKNAGLSDQIEELEDEIENPSFYKTIKTWFGFMGLSMGWIGLYFIASVAYFRGQTLGKRLLQIRIVRLNNKPVGLFFSFERFGGYAAGLATGLLGFFQIFWDANRQAIHDKIASTVVIDTRPSKIKKTEHLRRDILLSNNPEGVDSEE